MRRFLPILMTLAAALPLHAQITQTIKVENTYEAEVAATEKQELPMALPDSLLRFDLDYDYSVFDQPYKGSYTFKPYRIGLTPEASDDHHSLYVKAGAGYSPRTGLDLVWAPKSRYGITLAARHDGYFGDYERGIEQDGEALFPDAHWGRDMHNTVAIRGSHGGDDWSLQLEAGYDGISARDGWRGSRQMHTGYFSTSIGSIDPDAEFFWRGGLRYGRTWDKMADYGSVGENNFRFDGCFGPAIGASSKLLMDVGLQVVEYGGGLFDSHVGLMSLRPVYYYEGDAWRFSLGAEISTIIRHDENPTPDGRERMHSGRWRLPIPVASISYDLIEDALQPYAEAGGGATVNSWSSLVGQNHFMNPYDVNIEQAPLENSYESLRVAGGIRGRIRYRFSYDLSLGYFSMHNGLVYGATMRPDGPPAYGYAFIDYTGAFADFKYDLHLGGFSSSGQLGWRRCFYDHEEIVGIGIFRPGNFNGDLKLRYNWRSRIEAGVSGRFETVRKADGIMEGREIPGWFDLGLDASYAFTRRLSAWAHVGNLLDHPVQVTPYHTRRGVWFTAGIQFKL